MTNLSGNTTFDKCGITLQQIEFYQSFSWWIGGVTSTFISVSGIILNILAVCILCNKRVAPSLFNRLLISLAAMDNLFLSATIFDASKDQLIKPPLPFYLSYIFVNIMYPVRSISMCASIYMTVGLAFERYTFLDKPLYHRTRHNTNTYTRVFLYIISSVTFSCLYYIPRFFDLEIEENTSNCDFRSQQNETLNINEPQNCTVRFDINPTKIRQNPYYILWYINISNLAVTGLVPGVLLAFFNYKIYQLLKRNKIQRASMVSRCNSNGIQEQKDNSKDTRRTFILFAIVVLFVVCHALRIVMNIEEVTNLARQMEGDTHQCPLRYWAIITIPISSLMIQINAGANFFIYCQFDKTFREILCSKISKRNEIVTNTRKYQDTFELQEMQ